MSGVTVKRTSEGTVCPGAAELEVFGPRQGEESADRLAVAVEVTLGEGEYPNPEAEDGFGITLAFRRVIVALMPDRCEVDRDGRYERIVPAEEFRKAIVRQENEASGTSTEAGAEAEAQAGFEASWFAKLFLGIRGKAETSCSFGDTRTVDIETVAHCAVVGVLPGHRWEIGRFIADVLGAREGPLGVLRGSFFAQPSTAGEGSDLCAVTATGTKGFTVTVELRAKIADCIVTPLGPEAGGSLKARMNKALIEQRLGIKFLEEKNRRKGHKPSPGEVVLARAAISVKPAKGQDR